MLQVNVPIRDPEKAVETALLKGLNCSPQLRKRLLTDICTLASGYADASAPMTKGTAAEMDVLGCLN